LREFNGEDDHVHLLAHHPPKLPISTLVNRLKGVSAHYLRKEFEPHVRQYLWGNRLWSPSYFAASCGSAPWRSSASTSRIRNDRSETRRAPPGSRVRGIPALKSRDSLQKIVEDFAAPGPVEGFELARQLLPRGLGPGY
jgi:putative transposase